jgi:hypothetical protein
MNDLAGEIHPPIREPPASLIRVVDRAIDAVAEAEFACEVHGQPPGAIGEVFGLDLFNERAAIVVGERASDRILQVETFAEDQRGQEAVLSKGDGADVRRQRVYSRKGADSWTFARQSKLGQEDIVGFEDFRSRGLDAGTHRPERDPRHRGGSLAGRPGGSPVEKEPRANPDEQAGGHRTGNPSLGQAWHGTAAPRARRSHRETDDTGRMMGVLEAPRDVLLQCLQPLGREEGVGFTRCLDAQCLAEPGDPRESIAAALTVGEVFGKPGVNPFAAAFGDVTIKQGLVPEMAAEGHHA